VRDLVAPDTTVLDRRHVVCGCPIARDVLLTDVDFAGLEGLELYRDVTIILVADRFEVVAAAVHPKILGPPVGHATIGDRAAWIE
jgi:hypothetical protein